MKPNFAIFRYPDSSECAYVECDDSDVSLSPSVATVGCTDGFVFAPFEANDTTPVVTIKGKPVSFNSDHTGGQDSALPCRITREKADRQQYGRDFDAFHRLVEKGMASKIVLARAEDVETDTVADAFRMFAEACRQNPHCFVALVRTTVAGTWLTATPEILLERCGGEYRTMALAGTMSLCGDTEECVWSEKNRTEQRLVADYIRGIVKEYTCDLTEDGPYTFHAGGLVHLRTDFRFRADGATQPGDIISRLHPTPAVCGFPMALCREFIVDHESGTREYYSGFCGPVSATDTHLYVTLRCMKVNGTTLTLYAGGGILSDSRVEEEWNETVCKMQAMKACITKP